MDDIMTHIVDTTLRICVENRLYKITELGTFSVDINKQYLLEETINRINSTIIDSLKAGESITLQNDVTFTKTFSDENISSSNMVVLEELDTNKIVTKASNNPYVNSFHNDYNVKSYVWKNHGFFKKIFDFLRGKDVSKENEFSSNRRVQVSVFDVNYAFYASAGIKVKMQKRKRFLGIPYWKSEKAEKLVIGFNGLDGVMKYNNPQNYSSINPSANKQWGTFTGTLNNIPSKFYYGLYSNLSFIKDWTNSIVCLIPEIRPGDNKWKDNICNKLYETPAKLVYNQLKSLENKYIYNPIKRKITPTEPMVAYFVWGNTSISFDKEHPYITGIKEYSNCKSKSVIFDRSFGFSINNRSVSGFLPSEFDIKQLDVFGAAYYDKQWKGIRFYYYK